MLTLLSGDHDSNIRAEVAFAAGANSWRTSQELRDRTLATFQVKSGDFTSVRFSLA
jgi:hypothetical protein